MYLSSKPGFVPLLHDKPCPSCNVTCAAWCMDYCFGTSGAPLP